MNLKKRNIKKDLENLKKFSTVLEKRLGNFDQKYEDKIKNLSVEELQDIQQVVQNAYFILTKYEDKKEVHSLLKEFVAIIEHSGSSIDLLNDDINELVFSAESALNRIKHLQNDVSNNYFLEVGGNTKHQAENSLPSKPSTNNLTKSATAVYT